MTAPHSDGPHSVLLAAGLAPLDAVTDGPVDRVRAHTHTHPALGDRRVVRLVPEALAPAEDAALDFLGFTAEAASDPLALARPRGLGYPEWALVHDPDSRDTALSLVRPIERASRMAANRPGPASDEFARIAADVPLHHLPAYWEQAGRAFLAADNARLAAVMFGRARESEQVYSLPVDEATRRESFLEFAFSGALTVKSLSAHANELSQRYAPDRALAEFRELAVRRTLGGLPPWTGLPKQIRTLARAAGLDPAEEERSLLRELLAAPATASAPEGFWKAARSGLVALGRADADIARLLLGTFVAVPYYTGTDFHAWWLGLLDDAGAIDLLADPDQPVPGGAAEWVSRMVTHTRGYRRPLPLGFLDLVTRVADRLRADGVPVDPAGGRGSYVVVIPAALLDLCLELGIPITAGGRTPSLDLPGWLENRNGEPRRELAFLRADPAWEPCLERAVASYGRDFQQTLEDLLPFPYLHPYVDRRLGTLVEGIAEGGLAGLRERLETLRGESDGEAFRYFPHRLEQLRATDVDGALARTLRAGIVDEYSWPALEEAARELGADSVRETPLAGVASWPNYTLTSQVKAIAVGPEGRVAEHALVLPKGARDPRAVYADGQFLVTYAVDGPEAFNGYWSGAPDTRFTLRYDSIASGQWNHFGDVSAPLAPDGARVAGHRALRAGDQSALRDQHTLHDGHTFWVSDHRTDSLYEIDPATGARGRDSLPAFLEDLSLEEGENLRPLVSTLAPLPGPVHGSPLGPVSGLAGFATTRRNTDGGAVFRVTATDGRSVETAAGFGNRYAPIALFRAPGDERDLLLTKKDGAALHHPEHGLMWSCHTGTACDCTAKWGTPYLPPVVFWYFMRPRDTAASSRLRTVRGSDMSALTAAATDERKHVDRVTSTGLVRGRRRQQEGALLRPAASESLPEPLARTREAAAALLGHGRGGGSTVHPELVWGVAGLACSAVRLRHDLDEYLARSQKAAEQVELAGSGPEPEGLMPALDLFVPQVLVGGGGDVRCHIELTSRFLRGEAGVAELATRPPSDVDWTNLIGAVGALAWSATLSTTDDQERDALVDFLARWADTVFADPGAELDSGLVVCAPTHVPRLEGEGQGRARRAGLDLQISFAEASTVSDPETAALLAEHERRYGKKRRGHHFVELRSGDPLPFSEAEPGPGTETGTEAGTADTSVAECGRERIGPGWGTAERITALLTALAEHGPLTWDPAAARLLADRTGLAPAAAALLLSLQVNHRVPEAGSRRTLGINDHEVRVGVEELGSLSQGDLLELYREALPDTAEGIAALWEPGGLGQVAERLAEAWNRLHGRREPLPETTLTALATAWRPASVPHLRAFRDPSGHPVLSQDATSRPEVVELRYYTETILRFTPAEANELPGLLAPLANLVPWAHAELPAGDPFRESVPAALQAVRARLDSPGLLLRAVQLWSDRADAVLDLVGGEPYRDASGRTPFVRSADNGTVVAECNERGRLGLWFRPARLDDGVESKVLRGILDDESHNSHGWNTVRIVDLLRSPGYTAIAERLAPGVLAEGARETDPAASVPGLLSEVSGTLGLSEDAARLYLQFLALLEPTDKLVRAVNGWTPARHRKAGAELQERGLVLAAKRSRAGRTLFLPGEWVEVKQAPNLPFENWKRTLYGLQGSGSGLHGSLYGRHLPVRPLPEIFAEAWQRVRAGDAPGR
ncbi:hypothetical protein [Nocardiopsis ganjiahuensis]|uniref:hypothetical protein n=1 Tax=Nocardiopsis ganjiahuensis TaxID=239984 RepID=UPI00034AAED6|nr:hypothetical protein [Nocardiopsis ganjiahuensis]